MNPEINDIIFELKGQFPRGKRILLEIAAKLSGEIRSDDRVSKEYFNFAQTVSMIRILSEMNADPSLLLAGFFHDLYDDSKIMKMVKSKFGPEVFQIVLSFGKVNKLTHEAQFAGNEEEFIHMVLTVAEDLRVVFLFLADRYYKNVNPDVFSVLDRELLAERSLIFYAPLAHRLGLGKFKSDVEDSAFKVQYPELYSQLSEKYTERHDHYDRFIEKTLEALTAKFAEHNLKAELSGRTKQLISIHRKMEKTGRPFENIFDVLALRAIVNSTPDCYKALAVVLQDYEMVLDEFDDYIVNPKPNGYQSIHVLLRDKEGVYFELQIRTYEMHKTAEYGVAAHWEYKENKQGGGSAEFFKWLREHVEFKGEAKDEKPINHFFNLREATSDIFVLTPAGDFKKLSIGATPLDFAFSIHRDVGIKCNGAKVNGVIVPFETALKNGDRVEIMLANKPMVNSGWLSLAHSNRARMQIRRHLREEMRGHSIKLGEEIVAKGFRKAKISQKKETLKQLCEKFKFAAEDDLFAAVGTGKIALQKMIEQLNGKVEEVEVEAPVIEQNRKPKGLTVGGMNNLMVNFAKCCMPISGDPILGYITRGKGITVHRTNCRNAPQIRKEPERMIDVDWGQSSDSMFTAGIKVELSKSVSFVKEITPKFGANKVVLVNSESYQVNRSHQFVLVVQVLNREVLQNFMHDLNSMSITKNVKRLNYSEYKSLIRKPVGLG